MRCVEGPIEEISHEEVDKAMKQGKAPSPTGVNVEMLENVERIGLEEYVKVSQEAAVEGIP